MLKLHKRLWESFSLFFFYFIFFIFSHQSLPVCGNKNVIKETSFLVNTGGFLQENLAGFFLAPCAPAWGFSDTGHRGGPCQQLGRLGPTSTASRAHEDLSLTEHMEKQLCLVYPQLKMCSKQRLSCGCFCPNVFIRGTLAANVISAEYSQKPSDENNLFIFSKRTQVIVGWHSNPSCEPISISRKKIASIFFEVTHQECPESPSLALRPPLLCSQQSATAHTSIYCNGCRHGVNGLAGRWQMDPKLYLCTSLGVSSACTASCWRTKKGRRKFLLLSLHWNWPKPQGSRPS